MSENHNHNHRPSWDTYFLKLAMLVSERSTCPRMHCGCVLVRDKQILSTGYNGSIPGGEHCEDAGCLVVDNHCIRTIHGEMNAILQCSTHGISTTGATAYVTNMPCTNCAKALIAARIKEIVIFSDYHDTLAEKFFSDAGVSIRRLEKPDNFISYDLESFSSARKTEKSR
ncbi:MAG: dCMP deaminase [Ignavibacteria bacterium]|jgi:dCMP deaminase|nr:dCMP deaminase [Ignavibacteria bacterium]MCU7513928.1 dCMP deaminase [Ignavibacteria bacterium]MCU7522123.1 dCMP deaminase [Ignavibacteria bacterium]MCU7526164.1 dCMP deaminase [Ignavibacteria bacterium]HEX2963444.1 cytidine/deoxycytidylate deaminase family protein [Ignavibacteriales bacterium]